MKPKFFAVKIKDHDPATTGWEVRAKQDGIWFTVCETWAFGGLGADEWARRIASALNKHALALNKTENQTRKARQ